MKISRVKIKNYRSIKDLDLPVESYTAFVGANGAGKSSVLYAIEWFFLGGPLSLSDVTGHLDADFDFGDDAPVVEVTVTFTALSDSDRARLEQYGRGSTATFKRSWKVGEEKDKVVGNALQGPGFAAVRQMKLVGDFRPAYAALRSSVAGLPDLGAAPQKDAIVAAFMDWESDPSHAGHLEEINSADASHMFGIGGSHVIQQCVRMVLIPAATDISFEIGAAKKGTALDSLIGSLMANAGVEAKQAWIEKNAAVIQELTDSMLSSVQASTGLQTGRINDRLAMLVPNAAITFTAGVPAWVPSPIATVQTDVSIDGNTNDVSRQGHGIQRAVMIAMFQSLVPDADLAKGQHEKFEGETDEQAADRLTAALSQLPNLLVCIEEPEIYQHPIRARAFARVLAELAEQSNAQVLIATHSPYFARPEQFAGIRRFRLEGGETQVTSTSVDAVALQSAKTSDQVEKIVEKRLPTTSSEGFFADKVVLVEGDTDRAILESLAELLGTPLDAAGISVLDMAGKEGLAIPNAMMHELGIPAYLIADADALGAARRHHGDPEKQAQAHQSHKQATEDLITNLPASSALLGALPFQFEDPTVVCSHYTIWHDDIETELERWESFVEALSANGHHLRDKDLLAYRTAVMEASPADLPEALRLVVDAVLAF